LLGVRAVTLSESVSRGVVVERDQQARIDVEGNLYFVENRADRQIGAEPRVVKFVDVFDQLEPLFEP
jgi:hypothetical protein